LVAFLHGKQLRNLYMSASARIDWSYPVEGIFPVANMLALATETIETHPDLERYAHWELAKR